MRDMSNESPAQTSDSNIVVPNAAPTDTASDSGAPPPPKDLPASTPPASAVPPTAPPAAKIVVDAPPSERETSLSTELEAERKARKDREIRVNELEDENRRLKQVTAPSAPRPKRFGPLLRTFE
jgi:hypothetical protein